MKKLRLTKSSWAMCSQLTNGKVITPKLVLSPRNILSCSGDVHVWAHRHTPRPQPRLPHSTVFHSTQCHQPVPTTIKLHREPGHRKMRVPLNKKMKNFRSIMTRTNCMCGIKLPQRANLEALCSLILKWKTSWMILIFNIPVGGSHDPKEGAEHPVYGRAKNGIWAQNLFVSLCIFLFLLFLTLRPHFLTISQSLKHARQFLYCRALSLVLPGYCRSEQVRAAP